MRRLSLALLPVLVLAACGRAPSDAADKAGASSPDVSASPADVQASSRAAVADTLPPTASAPPVSAAGAPEAPPPLARDVRSCFPPELDGAWAEAARVEEGGSAWVRLARWNAPEDFRGAFVLIAEGGCQHALVGMDTPPEEHPMPLPSFEAIDHSLDQEAAWRIRQQGGVGALMAALRAAYGGPVRECNAAEETGCVPTWMATRLRAQGADVAPPRY